MYAFWLNSFLNIYIFIILYTINILDKLKKIKYSSYLLFWFLYNYSMLNWKDYFLKKFRKLWKNYKITLQSNSTNIDCYFYASYCIYCPPKWLRICGNFWYYYTRFKIIDECEGKRKRKGKRTKNRWGNAKEIQQSTWRCSRQYILCIMSNVKWSMV